MAGLIKAVLALQHRKVPPNLHFEKLNPHIDVKGFPVVFPTEMVSLKSDGDVVAGVSSFGFGGTNAHAVAESAIALAVPTQLEQVCKSGTPGCTIFAPRVKKCLIHCMYYVLSSVKKCLLHPT